MKTSKSQSVLNTFKEVYGYLSMKRRKQFWVLFVGMLFVSVIDTVTVGIIALFATVVSSPEKVLQSNYMNNVQQILRMDFLTSVRGVIVSVSLVVVFFVGLKNGLYTFVYYWITRLGAEIEAFFGEKLLKGFIAMPYEWHLSQNTADIILAIQWRVFLGQSFITPCMTTMSDVLTVLILLSTLLLVQPITAITLLLLIGGIGFILYTKTRHLQEKAARRCEEYDLSLNRHATTGIHGIKDVKISGQTSFVQNFKKDALLSARTRGLRYVFEKLPIVVLETVGFIMLTSIVCLMLFFTKTSMVQIIATISLLVVAAWRMLPAIARILSGFTGIRNIMPYIQTEIRHLKNIESNTISNNMPIPNHKTSTDFKFNNEISLENVSFVYENRGGYVLEDITLCIKKGQTVGFIGASGAGKSTLVDIFIGLLSPSKGQIKIDGNQMDMRKRINWMTMVGYVSQSPYVYDGTLAGNVAFGLHDSEIDRDLVLECCRMASMQDILDDLPQGIDTLIGERGMRLSGGQKQRVIIARALYFKPEVIIFDEATSSLDYESEKAIQDAIYGFKGKQTVIIVAHRLSTVRDCDFLVWIENGKIKMVDMPEKVLKDYCGLDSMAQIGDASFIEYSK